jgi:signal transduction histidine kinase
MASTPDCAAMKRFAVGGSLGLLLRLGALSAAAVAVVGVLLEQAPVTGVARDLVLTAGLLLVYAATFAVLAASGRLNSRTDAAPDAAGELELASDAKARFLARMSHELRTPLNSIIGFSELLGTQEFGPLNERQLRYAHNISSSGHHLLTLINDLLDLSTAEAGKMTVSLEDVELNEVLDSVVRKVRPLADAKTLDLRIENGPGLVVHADRRRLDQVLWNLLSNAIKFTPAGGSVIVTASADDAGVHVRVRDTGIGIPAEEMERVFEEFAQVDTELTKEQDGTGLGLPLSRHLLQLMDGAIHVESAPGTGSTFTIRLREAAAAIA